MCRSSVNLRRCVWWGSCAVQWWWGSAVDGWLSMSSLSRMTLVEVPVTLTHWTLHTHVHCVVWCYVPVYCCIVAICVLKGCLNFQVNCLQDEKSVSFTWCHHIYIYASMHTYICVQVYIKMYTCSEVKASVLWASIKLGEWLTDRVSMRFSPWASLAMEVATEIKFGT